MKIRRHFTEALSILGNKKVDMAYFKGHYKGLNKDNVAQKVREEGFNPIVINNSPGFVYSKHKHPETKLLAILSGNIKVKVGGKTYNLKKGDKLIIPGNVYHSAVVEKDGCEFFWSEKII